MSHQILYGILLLGIAAATIAGVVQVPSQTVPIIGFGTLIVMQILGLLQGARAAGHVSDVAVRAEAVAVAVKASDSKVAHIEAVTEHTQQTVQAVHTLVNSATGVQLKLNAVMARRLASLTKLAPDDIAATEAERLYDEHQAKQAIVDSDPPPLPMPLTIHDRPESPQTGRTEQQWYGMTIEPPGSTGDL